MNRDISLILNGWPYNPNEVTVRRIIGFDGREKLQMRLDLGVLQMEMDGRPDGERPHGFESLLDFHIARLETHRRENGGDADFSLDDDECGELRGEAMQYYHRYLSLFHLGDYASVLRDTERNLQAFDFMREWATDESDRAAIDQYRPYVLMMNTRGMACLELEMHEFDRALDIIGEGVERIENFLRDAGREEMIESCREINFLEEWAERVRNQRPLTEAEQLRRELEVAVESENYERAAQLRDQIKDIA